MIFIKNLTFFKYGFDFNMEFSKFLNNIIPYIALIFLLICIFY